ncbi:hypothetical protein TWF788_003452 [Orbilia oligospora]|uniref:Alpha-methylacyl-CoA racemase n=1 Tax=Orbilia oligospora TaxID=2813651 RepID=A0A7C8K2U4_ORBOL|nr:hypothetical protein TWF788_003452 [Orbilia oligospora]
MTSPPPLSGIRVLELAGLAPGPFAGLLLADYGATVLRLDRATPETHGPNPLSPTRDQLTRRKSSIAVDMRSPGGLSFIKALVPHVDILIDPFRPGVLEKAGLCPKTVLTALNPRLIVARMTGFRRDGKYAQMAGHDINYIAVSGVLSMLGREGPREDPSTWKELRALFTKLFKEKTRAEWETIFDGTDACCTPVLTQGELEEQEYDQRPLVTLRDSPSLAIVSNAKEEKDVGVRAAKGQGEGVEGDGWNEDGLSPGVGGEVVLEEWVGWRRGRQFEVERGGLVFKEGSKL